MVGSSKILTVSYGTFSCTLEGFDDPFSTMKSIAEYFRDLAADDRYFGAEPPTPDADMLHRIAEREVQRRVEARVEDDGIILRQTEGATVAAPEPAKAPLEAPAAPVADMEGIEPESDNAADGSVAAKLSRIRAVVAQNRAAPATAATATDDDYEAPLDDTYYSGDISDAFQDVAPEDEIAAIEDIEAELAAAPDSTLTNEESLDVPADDPAENVNEQAPIPEDTASIVAKNAEDAAGGADGGVEALEEPTAYDAGVGTEPEPEDETSQEPTADMSDDAFDAAVFDDAPRDIADIEDEDEIDSDEVAVAAALDAINASETPEPDATAASAPSGLTSRIVKLKRALMDAAPSDEIGGRPGEADAPAADASDDASILAAIAGAQDTVDARDDVLEDTGLDANPSTDFARDAADLAADAPEADVVNPSVEEDENPFEHLDLQDDGIEPPEADETEELAALDGVDPTDVEDVPEYDKDVAADDAAFAAPDGTFEPDAAEDETLKPDDAGAAAFDRILEETNSKLADDEGSRRRSAIAHLKAAVAATKADRLVKTGKAREEEEEQEQSQYREDLAKVVRPRRPSEGRVLSEPRERPTPLEDRPAPLMLVSEQRVDGDLEEEAPRAAIQPRRVNTEILRMQGEVGGEDLSFADFAKQMNATELPDLLEAAAAYSAFVEGQKHFSRPQLMRRIASYERDSYTREAGLRSFGQLLRQGKIQKLKRGQFTITPETRFNPEARIAGE